MQRLLRSSSTLAAGDSAGFEVDVHVGELRKHGLRVKLQDRPLQVLVVLMECPGELVTRDQLRQRLWPADTDVDFERNINIAIHKLRAALNDIAAQPRYVETLPRRGYRFVGKIHSDGNAMGLIKIVEGQSHGSADQEHLADFDSVRGALPLASPYYIERGIDAAVHRAAEGGDSVILLKGARQTGKTSLLARVLQRARMRRVRTAVTDLQKVNASQLESVDGFLLFLAQSLADQIGLDIDASETWSPRRGASVNFDRFLKREALDESNGRLVWGIDEADRLFPHLFASEVFGLLRSWHNERALESESPCRRLTLVIAYATEAHLFITDLNQSPFNVGTRFVLHDFTFQEVEELNRRYGEPLDSDGVRRIEEWLGGHPFLTQTALHELVSRRVDLRDFIARAVGNDGPFGDHLHRLALSLSRNAALCQAFNQVLAGQETISTGDFYRLRSAGVVRGESPADAAPRCRLYADYFRKQPLNL